jgi:2-desacetyl-2-hydroxyethyl bacteriochlorophyllide A dehydrogenase
MKAIVCRQPGELAVEDRPDPVPGPGELLVKIRRVGICGTDYHIYEGLHPYLDYPRVMGHELAAEVVEAPEGHRLRPGQAVVVNPYLACGACVACRHGKPNCCMRIAVLGVHRDGGMCEYLSIPEGNLYAAGALSLDAAAAVEFLAIGAHAVRRAGIAPGTRTLVAGAGPIGLGAAIFAGIAGAPVTLIDRDPERLALAQPIAGAERTIVADDAALQAIADITHGNGFDVVIDATGNRSSMERGFDHVAHGGTYVLISVVRDHITFSDPEFHKREMTLMGSRNADHDDFHLVMASIVAGKVPIADLMTHRTSLVGAVHDLPRWAHAKDGLVKALIDLDEVTPRSA